MGINNLFRRDFRDIGKGFRKKIQGKENLIISAIFRNLLSWVIGVQFGWDKVEYVLIILGQGLGSYSIYLVYYYLVYY